MGNPLKEVGNPPAGRLRRLSLHFAVVNLIHSRRVRRRNRSANGCPPEIGTVARAG
jgi:hypothetical protein